MQAIGACLLEPAYKAPPEFSVLRSMPQTKGFLRNGPSPYLMRGWLDDHLGAGLHGPSFCFAGDRLLAFEEGRPEEAKAELEKALKLLPDSPELLELQPLGREQNEQTIPSVEPRPIKTDSGR